MSTPTEFTDAWNNSKCDPTQLHPGGNDIDAVGDQPVRRPQPDARLLLLPRLHRGRTTTCSPTTSAAAALGGNDPEIGNAQAGALTGGQPSYLGRDNANQIALQDGIPGITNQYLFQPIAGAFYSPAPTAAST